MTLISSKDSALNFVMKFSPSVCVAVVASLTSEVALQSFAYHAHGTNPVVIHGHEKTLNQQTMHARSGSTLDDKKGYCCPSNCMVCTDQIMMLTWNEGPRRPELGTRRRRHLVHLVRASGGSSVRGTQLPVDTWFGLLHVQLIRAEIMLTSGWGQDLKVRS